MTDGFTVSLRTIPPGSIIKRHEQHPDGLPIFLEWEELDGSLHVMRITADATSPVGFRVRVSRQLLASRQARQSPTFRQRGRSHGRNDGMSDAPISFAEARAVKEENSKLWSPTDALRAMLRDIESGEIKPSSLVIWYTQPAEDNRETVHHCVAGVDRKDHVYLLNLALRRVLNEVWS